MNNVGERVLVNFSNHPSSKWDKDQMEAAEQYGRVVDIAFPVVDENDDEEKIKKIGDEYLEEIMQYAPAAVMLQGEFTLSYYVIKELRKRNITVLAACTKRETYMDGDMKISIFKFKRFRAYA
jgi:hypothetical protein